MNDNFNIPSESSKDFYIFRFKTYRKKNVFSYCNRFRLYSIQNILNKRMKVIQLKIIQTKSVRRNSESEQYNL